MLKLRSLCGEDLTFVEKGNISSDLSANVILNGLIGERISVTIKNTMKSFDSLKSSEDIKKYEE